VEPVTGILGESTTAASTVAVDLVWNWHRWKVSDWEIEIKNANKNCRINFSVLYHFCYAFFFLQMNEIQFILFEYNILFVFFFFYIKSLFYVIMLFILFEFL
jgi:hypothetical protein